jgi:hypothetical protein
MKLSCTRFFEGDKWTNAYDKTILSVYKATNATAEMILTNASATIAQEITINAIDFIINSYDAAVLLIELLTNTHEFVMNASSFETNAYSKTIFLIEEMINANERVTKHTSPIGIGNKDRNVVSLVRT